MTLRIVLVGAAIAIGSATLLAQDEQPQLTPRTTPKPQASDTVGPTAVTPATPKTAPAAPAAASASATQSTPQLIVQNPSAPSSASEDVPEFVTVPAGTKIPLTLKQGINTKNAHVGDAVYAQTAFPITQNDQIVIPAGTFVRGEIQRVQRPGKIKGRAELLMSFNSLIYPNGYTVILPGAVHGTPGSPDNDVKGQEGTIQGGSNKGKDAGRIAATTIQRITPVLGDAPRVFSCLNRRENSLVGQQLIHAIHVKAERRKLMQRGGKFYAQLRSV
jgi:hypothetical protein